MLLIRLLLIPFALIYGVVITVRNLLFDWGILPSEEFSIPVISLGNLSSGGAGKTPHVEYLVRLLKDRYSIAVLSRGYRRKTKGFLVAGKDSTSLEIGDEPLQMYRKFPDITVAVHEKRRKGIHILQKKHPEINLIILDDAFQHRYVKPGLNLLLTGYYNPFFRNFLLPVGNLREAKFRARRADALIVTKTPRVFSPLDRRYFLKKLEPYCLKKTFFSGLSYGKLQPLTPDTPANAPRGIKTIFLLTGIARSDSLEEYLKTKCEEVFIHKYTDHHRFTQSNLKKLKKQFDRTVSRSKVVITTEKDAMRLIQPGLLETLGDIPVYYLPVSVVFHEEDKQKFDRMIHEFLKKFS